MPRRDGHLFEFVMDFGNLLKAANQAMQGCGRTLETCEFFFNLEPKLLQLRDELDSEAYAPGDYHFFTVHDPKVRTIAVAPFRDRVVHHAIVGVLTPIYERRFIFDTYATRPNMGTHKAILRAQRYVRKWPWFLKADVHKYFDSVDHGTLMAALERRIKDCKLLRLLARIISNAPVPGRGLPIGNLTSQFLANVYLDPLDHFVKDYLGVKGYVRYMDDMVLFGEGPRMLQRLLACIEAFLGERLKLRFKEGGVWLNRAGHGLSFLGMRIFPELLRVRAENRRRSFRRILHRLDAFERGEVSEDRLHHGLVSSVGHLRHFCPSLALVEMVS